MKKVIIFMLIALLFLSSCGNGDSEKQSSTTDLSSESVPLSGGNNDGGEKEDIPSYLLSANYSFEIVEKRAVELRSESGNLVSTIEVSDILKEGYSPSNIAIELVYFLDDNKIIIKAVDKRDDGDISIFYFYDIPSRAEITSIGEISDLSFLSYSDYDLRFVRNHDSLMIAKSGDKEFVPAKAALIGSISRELNFLTGDLIEEDAGMTIKTFIMDPETYYMANYNQYTGFVDVYMAHVELLQYVGSEEIEELRGADTGLFASKYKLSDSMGVVLAIDESNEWEAGGSYSEIGWHYYHPIKVSGDERYMVSVYDGRYIEITNRESGEVEKIDAAEYAEFNGVRQTGGSSYYLTEDILMVVITDIYAEHSSAFGGINILYDLKEKKPITEIIGVNIEEIMGRYRISISMAEGVLFIPHAADASEEAIESYYLYLNGEKLTAQTIDKSYRIAFMHTVVSPNGRYLAAHNMVSNEFSVFYEENGSLQFVRTEPVPEGETIIYSNFEISDSGEIKVIEDPYGM